MSKNKKRYTPKETDRTRSKEQMVAIARVFHLFPFRTEKLSPVAPMVLRLWESRSLPTNINRVMSRDIHGSFFLDKPHFEAATYSRLPTRADARFLPLKSTFSTFYPAMRDRSVTLPTNKQES